MIIWQTMQIQYLSTSLWYINRYVGELFDVYISQGAYLLYNYILYCKCNYDSSMLEREKQRSKIRIVHWGGPEYVSHL